VEFNLADLFEVVVDTVPEREALVVAGGGTVRSRLRYDELAARVARVAGGLARRGVGVGDHVGIHLFNCAEYVEVMLALFSLRAVPVNVNHRYVAEELDYLFRDAELRAVVTEPELAATVRSVAGHLPLLHTVVERGEDYERLVAEAPARPPDVGPRSADDLYLLYTGGTTGKPKGVMWRHEDVYFAALGGRGVPSQGIAPLAAPGELPERIRRDAGPGRRLPLCPLMHGGAQWIALQALLSGGSLVLDVDRHFEPADALDVIAAERVELVMVIGDATARPLADALRQQPGRWDLSALQVVASGGAVLSPAVTAALAEVVPTAKVVDTFGASETGGQGRLARRGPGDTPRLVTDGDTAVLGEDLRPVAPGAVGRLARRGHVPLGYWKDEARTAATFPVVDGERWAVPGDYAVREHDGTVTLLGRGATCINTGGEKVYPEEVEAAIKQHPAVFDCLVVGVPDERFGQRVAAVVACQPGVPWPGDDALEAEVRRHLAGYKVPRAWVRVAHCERLPTGKADYTWARDAAEAAVWAS
jgi:acyl-CoA synthetase (AMP-forming)/AMP-acid ligase II